MRSAVLEAPEQLRIGDRLSPQLGPGEVLIDVEHSGVCGTDVGIFNGRIPVRYPRVLGHEIAGKISAVDAANDSGLAPGTRVVVDPNLYCGRCYQCSRGQQNICTNGALMGRDVDGGFQETVAVPTKNVYPLPDAVPLSVAPLLQVVTVCMHGQRMAELFTGEAVVVIGLGVTGLIHLQLARARGAHPVIGVTRSPSKRSIAEQLGADLTLDASDAQLAASIKEATEGRGPDLVIEAAGKEETLRKAIELARVGGRIMLFGTLTATKAELPFYQLYYKEIELFNPRAAKAEDFPTTIAAAASGTLKLEPIVTNRFPLGRIGDALRAAQASDTLKVILDHEGAAT